VAKKANSIMSETDDPSDLTPPGSRAEPFGAGSEGRSVRREHGHTGRGAGLLNRVRHFLERLGQFLHDVRIELRRVSWPTPTEIKNTTIITLIAMIFFAAYLFAVDEVWAFLIDRLISLLGGA
jgi:preprotein translocase subunit SecE